MVDCWGQAADGGGREAKKGGEARQNLQLGSSALRRESREKEYPWQTWLKHSTGRGSHPVTDSRQALPWQFQGPKSTNDLGITIANITSTASSTISYNYPYQGGGYPF